MRKITTHSTPFETTPIVIKAMDENGTRYEIAGFDSKKHPDHLTVMFQVGDPEVVGQIGLTIESLLAVAADRLEVFQAGKYPCQENDYALHHIKSALHFLHERTARIAEATKELPILDTEVVGNAIPDVEVFQQEDPVKSINAIIPTLKEMADIKNVLGKSAEETYCLESIEPVLRLEEKRYGMQVFQCVPLIPLITEQNKDHFMSPNQVVGKTVFLGEDHLDQVKEKVFGVTMPLKTFARHDLFGVGYSDFASKAGFSDPTDCIFPEARLRAIYLEMKDTIDGIAYVETVKVEVPRTAFVMHQSHRLSLEFFTENIILSANTKLTEGRDSVILKHRIPEGVEIDMATAMVGDLHLETASLKLTPSDVKFKQIRHSGFLTRDQEGKIYQLMGNIYVSGFDIEVWRVNYNRRPRLVSQEQADEKLATALAECKEVLTAHPGLIKDFGERKGAVTDIEESPRELTEAESFSAFMSTPSGIE